MFTSLFFVRLLTIVQPRNPPGGVDSGSNFEHPSSQNMRTRLKSEQNMWTWLNSMFFYPHKVTSVFLLPLFVFHPKFEFSLKFTHICLVKKRSFLPKLLSGCQPQSFAATQIYYIWYIIGIVIYNNIEFYLYLALCYDGYPLGNVFLFSKVLLWSWEEAQGRLLMYWKLSLSPSSVEDEWRASPPPSALKSTSSTLAFFWSLPPLLTPNGFHQGRGRCHRRFLYQSLQQPCATPGGLV